MFYVLEKYVDRRLSQRFFETFAAAQRAMQKDISDCKQAGFVVKSMSDYFNESKGFYVYEAKGVTPEGEKVIWSVVEMYFEK